MNKNEKTGGIGCLAIVLLALFLMYWKVALPITVVLIIGYIIYIVKQTKKEKVKQEQARQRQKDRKLKREEDLNSRFGNKLALKILNKKVEIGMTAEMVRESFGEPDKIKKIEKKDKVSEEWYWGEYLSRKAKMYKKYAVIVNDELIEFGDI